MPLWYVLVELCFCYMLTSVCKHPHDNMLLFRFSDLGRVLFSVDFACLFSCLSLSSGLHKHYLTDLKEIVIKGETCSCLDFDGKRLRWLKKRKSTFFQTHNSRGIWHREVQLVSFYRRQHWIQMSNFWPFWVKGHGNWKVKHISGHMLGLNWQRCLTGVIL